MRGWGLHLFYGEVPAVDRLPRECEMNIFLKFTMPFVILSIKLFYNNCVRLDKSNRVGFVHKRMLAIFTDLKEGAARAASEAAQRADSQHLPARCS